MTEPMIEAEAITKRFGKVEALAGLDLVAERGQVTAVLGPNGAGKTTFVRSVATLLRLDSGTLRVAGHDVSRDPKKVRQVIGLAGQHAAVEPAMTGRENLHMVARLYGLSRADATGRTSQVINQLDLDEVADRGAKTYSGGQRRRLDLAASLVGSPQLLVLDEPTTGLDPRSRSQLWDAIRQLVAQGTDVLLTTQYLDEADQLAHRIVIIDHGRVIAQGTPAELKGRAGSDMIEVRARRSEDVEKLAQALGPLGSEAAQIDIATRRVAVPVGGGPASITAAVQALSGLEMPIDDLSLRRPTLDEVFLTLTGSPATAADDGPDTATLADAGLV